MNDNFFNEHLQKTVQDLFPDLKYIGIDVEDGVQINSLDDALKFMDKIFEALGAFGPGDQPEPPTLPDQPHHGQLDAIADVLREPATLGFHDGVYYWEPWHVENDVKSNPPEATD